MFAESRLWPTFVGYQNDQIKDSDGVLPILVWQPQAVFEAKHRKANQIKKRKFDEANDTENSCGSPGRDSKRIRTRVIDNFIDSIKYYAGYLVIEPVKWLYGLINSKSNNQPNEPINITVLPEILNQLENHQINDDSSIETKTCNQVFESLQMKQYLIGPADAYGGDFSLYKGVDPSESHSIATVRVIYPTETTNHSEITARDLLAFARVQNQVAKSAVLAFVDQKDDVAISSSSKEKDDPVKYTVINFLAVSDRI